MQPTENAASIYECEHGHMHGGCSIRGCNHQTAPKPTFTEAEWRHLGLIAEQFLEDYPHAHRELRDVARKIVEAR